jgi:hypothetical protein
VGRDGRPVGRVGCRPDEPGGRQGGLVTGRQAGRREDVRGAAEALGVTVEAVRKRISRGTLRSEKGPDGTRYVWLDDGPDDGRAHNGSGPDFRADAVLDAKEETIAELRERVDQLGRILETRDEELRRKDTIIMTLAQRVPELEAPANGQDNSEEPSHGTREAEDGERENGPEKRSWWLRWLGG